MKEYNLKIKERSEFVVISAKMISALIREINNSSTVNVCIKIERIMPQRLLAYLLAVINSNRFSNERFRYRQFLDVPIEKMHLYKILQEQFVDLVMESQMCFNIFELKNVNGETAVYLECNELFWRTCKDLEVRFIYRYPDGTLEVVEH
jgi:hypothetical protein